MPPLSTIGREAFPHKEGDMNVYRKVSRSAATWLCAALLAASGHA